MLTISQMAKECNVSYALIYDAVKDGRINAIPFGRVYRIPDTEVKQIKTSGIPVRFKTNLVSTRKITRSKSGKGRRPWID